LSSGRVELLRELYAAFDFRSAAAGRLDDLFRRHAVPDFELVPPPIYPDTEVTVGLEGFDAFMRMLTEVWEEWRFEIEQMEDAGERVLVLLTLHARGRESGAVAEVSAAHVVTFRGERVARLEVFVDREEARAAAGLSAGP
jgi:ketosteroid isomerase-like protein